MGNNARIAIVLLISAILMGSASAANQPIKIVDEEQVKENIRSQGGPLGLAMEAIEDVEGELGVDLSTLDAKSAWVITGEELNGPERATLELAKANSPKLFASAKSASKTDFDEVSKSGKLVILIGGPAQNGITRQFEEKGLLTGPHHEYMNQMVIVTGKSDDGAKVVVLSDKRGFVNLPRKAASYSPLALCLPLQLVPIVASMIGAFLASVLAPVTNLIQTYIENVLADRKKTKMKITSTRFKLAGIKAREVIAVVVASSVLAVAMTWTFAGPSWDFLWLLPLNVFVCLLAGFSHEAVHWAAGKLVKIETEYKFWPAGSVSTVFSAFLGNAFGLQGFLLDDVKEGTPKWKVGVMKIAAPMFSTAVMLFFAVVNFFMPYKAFQMIYSISGVLAMAEMLPFKPMDGYDVRKWSIFIWFAAFLFIGACFVFVNFIL